MTPHAVGARDSMKDDLANAILSQIREDEIVAMCCDVVNIPSPTGEELEMGRYMRRALEDAGLSVTWQEVEEGRANVVGLWEGTGNGKSLMFNGHMDTSNTGRETFLTGLGYKAKAVIRGKMISSARNFADTESARITSSIAAFCRTCVSSANLRTCSWYLAITARCGCASPRAATTSTPHSRAESKTTAPSSA